tara:strand:+ start:2351 stop:2554 length:204 start_codon:yes stop_codon:yes gene_type:complete
MKISFINNKKNKKFNYNPRFQTKKIEPLKKKIVFKKRELSTKNNKINKSQLLILVGLLFLFLYIIFN